MARIRREGDIVVCLDDGCPLCGRPIETLVVKSNNTVSLIKPGLRKKTASPKVNEDAEKPS